MWYVLEKRGENTVLFSHKLHGSNINYIVFTPRFKEVKDTSDNVISLKEIFPKNLVSDLNIKVFRNDKQAAMLYFQELEKVNNKEEL